MNSVLRLVLLSLVIMVNAVHALHAQGIDLTERAFRFKIGDDPSYASADYNDDEWQIYPIYEEGGWGKRSIELDDQVFWQRLEFDGATLAHLTQPALYFGVLQAGNVLYLNGVEFARNAMFDQPFAGLLSNNNKALPQIFPIPRDLINFDGPNHLAIRSAINGLGTKFLRAPVEIVDERVALEKSKGRTIFFILYSSLSVFVQFLAFVVAVIVWVMIKEKNGIVWLLLAHATLLPLSIVNSTPILFLEVALPPIIYPFLIIILAGYLIVPILEFSARQLLAKIGWFVRLLQLSVLLLPFIPDFSGDFLFPISAFDQMIWLLQLLISFGLITFWATRATLKKVRRAYPMIVGACVIWTSTIASVMGFEYWAFQYTGTGLGEVTVPIFLLCLAWAAVQPFFEARAKLAAAQSEVIRAQEYERRRIAYDIHDGVGQWLSTIKLNLQMLQGNHLDKPVANDVADVVSHIDAAISDTRRIAHDLSPAMIEKRGLTAAMQSHADVMRSRSGIEVTVDADIDLQFSATAQGHLYRIFQEALQNAIKHGRATAIKVTLADQGKRFRFVIEDDGIGFDPNAHSSGIGLESMTRRAELVGAKLDIKTSNDKGTRIELIGDLPA